MEEILRAYARERRKCPEVRLHPATRTMLHAEVERTFPQKTDERKAGGWTGSLRALSLRLAFGGALGTMLILAVLSVRQKPQTKIAEMRERSAPVLTAAPAENKAMDKARPEEPLLREKTETERLKVRDIPNVPAQNIERQFVLEPGAQAVAENTPTVSPEIKDAFAVAKRISTNSVADRAEGLQVAARSFALSKPLVSTTRVAAIVPPQEKLAIANELTNLGAARRVHFAQLTRTNPPVLQTFQLEQFGDQVQLIDNDGSLYSGRIDPEPENLPAPQIQPVAPLQLRAQPALLQRLDNARALTFEARGTNRTLGREVVLTGKYYEKTNTAGEAQGAINGLLPSARLSRVRQLLVGTAIVGKTNQISVHAVSNEP